MGELLLVSPTTSILVQREYDMLIVFISWCLMHMFVYSVCTLNDMFGSAGILRRQAVVILLALRRVNQAI